MTMIDDFDAMYDRHVEEVEKLIRRQATSRKMARHFRLSVLRRQLEGGRVLQYKAQDDNGNIGNHSHNMIKHFEPDLVKLAVSAAKTLAHQDSTTTTPSLITTFPQRPQQQGRQQRHRRQRKTRKPQTDERNLLTTEHEINIIARSFHPLLHVYGIRNSVKEGIHVTEGGACDFYSVKLVKRPTHVVHIAIQDQHLQTIVEPRVLRFSERDWATPQLVCVSAIDDTDKSSESVESTMLEHVTASGDRDYNDIRFEVPVSISDNDGHYLWGFGSNAHRQFGVDEVGASASLPASITGNVVLGPKARRIKRSSDDDNNNNDDDDDDNDDDDDDDDDDDNDVESNDDDGDEERMNRNISGNKERKKRKIQKEVKHGEKDRFLSNISSKTSKRASFVTNAKKTKPSMLFSSIAAGRYTTCATQTNGKTTMHGRNDGTLWYGSRDYNPDIALSRRVGTRKTFIISVSAGTNHCMALNAGGTLMGWGMNNHGQLGLGDTSVISVEAPTLVCGSLENTKVLQISCGDSHTGAIDADGKLYTWGCSRTGSLGLHTTNVVGNRKRHRHLPVYVPGLSDFPEREANDEDHVDGSEPFAPTDAMITVGTTNRSSGSRSAVGPDRYSPIHAFVCDIKEDGIPFQVDCGWGHTAVICGQGKLYTCGWGANGRLGRSIPGHGGFYEAADPVFRQVTFHAATVHGKNNSTTNKFLVVNVACGRQHTLALDSERELWSWGANRHGQLGLGHCVAQATPRVVKILRPFCRDAERLLKKKRSTTTTSTFQSTHQKAVGKVENTYIPTSSKEQKHDLLAAIACGDSHSCVITEQGLLYVFGSNESSQLGLGDGCNDDEVFPRLHHPTLSLDVRQVSCGANHTLVVTGECPQRVYHAKSTFDDIMMRHKKLVERDQRRRKRFAKIVSKAEEKRKQMNWRRPVSMMIPTTKKAHARSLNIHGRIVAEHEKSTRPSSAGAYRRRVDWLNVSKKAVVYPSRRSGSNNRVMRWEKKLSPRPNIDSLARGPVRPSTTGRSRGERPSTAGTSRRHGASEFRQTARPNTAGDGKRPIQQQNLYM